MDATIAWALSVVAVSTWSSVVILDRAAHGTELGRTGHVTVLVVWALAIGTFLVSTLSVAGDPGGLTTFVVAFNRAVLAGSGVYALHREWRRFRVGASVR